MTPCRLRLCAARFMAGVIVTLLAAGPALAAPQLLVLLESGGRLPLQCGEARCVVELAAMCLQPERRMPEAGRPYGTNDPGAITVAGLDPAGAAVQRPLPATARITALRGHVAVRLEIPRPWLRRNFATLPGVAVANAVILEPIARAGDSRPITEGERRQAKDQAMATAKDTFATNPGAVLTAKVSNYLINALPAGPRVPPRALEVALQNALAKITASPADLSSTRFQVNYCQYSANEGLAASLQSCLQGRQDRALEDLHQDYVNALGTGS